MYYGSIYVTQTLVNFGHAQNGAAFYLLYTTNNSVIDSSQIISNIADTKGAGKFSRTGIGGSQRFGFISQ